MPRVASRVAHPAKFQLDAVGRSAKKNKMAALTIHRRPRRCAVAWRRRLQRCHELEVDAARRKADEDKNATDMIWPNSRFSGHELEVGSAWLPHCHTGFTWPNSHNCGRRGHRFYSCMERGCGNCGEPGHSGFACPNCANCGGRDHWHYSCPKRGCGKCGERGHIGFACPKFCEHCNVRGHELLSCPHVSLDQRIAVAAQEGKKDAVLQLFLEGASADGRDRMGNTSLCNAVIGGHKGIVNTLLLCHASPDARRSFDETPLMHAIQLGRHSIANDLLEACASVDLAHESNTALMYAAQFRNVHGVDLLLSHKASVNATREQGSTPLMIAVQDADCPDNVVRALLEAGSSCNHRVYGQTVKDRARRTHRKIIEEHEQKTLLLTLHVSVLEPGASFAFTCTNIGGDELASGVAELCQPAASLYAMIGSELQGEIFQLMFPDGRLLDDNVQILGDALSQPAEVSWQAWQV